MYCVHFSVIGHLPRIACARSILYLIQTQLFQTKATMLWNFCAIKTVEFWDLFTNFTDPFYMSSAHSRCKILTISIYSIILNCNKIWTKEAMTSDGINYSGTNTTVRWTKDYNLNQTIYESIKYFTCMVRAEKMFSYDFSLFKICIYLLCLHIFKTVT